VLSGNPVHGVLSGIQYMRMRSRLFSSVCSGEDPVFIVLYCTEALMYYILYKTLLNYKMLN